MSELTTVEQWALFIEAYNKADTMLLEVMRLTDQGDLEEAATKQKESTAAVASVAKELERQVPDSIAMREYIKCRANGSIALATAQKNHTVEATRRAQAGIKALQDFFTDLFNAEPPAEDNAPQPPPAANGEA